MTDALPNLNRYLDNQPSGDDVPAGDAFDAWRLRRLTAQELTALGDSSGYASPGQLTYLAWFGLLAPTTHNTVPQRFQLVPGGIRVWLDRRFVLPASDVVGRQATISCGCCMAQIGLAAEAFGWSMAAELCHVEKAAVLPELADEPSYTELGLLHFATQPPRSQRNELIEAMLARKVVRAEYDSSVQLDAPTIDAMQAIVARNPRLGLRREAELLPDEIAALAKASSRGMQTSSAVAVITTVEDKPTGWMEAGQAYGELVLLLQRRGYVVAMHAAATEVTAPNMALRGRLRTRHRPVVVFRIGRIARPEDGRRPRASPPSLGAHAATRFWIALILAKPTGFTGDGKASQNGDE